MTAGEEGDAAYGDNQLHESLIPLGCTQAGEGWLKQGW